MDDNFIKIQDDGIEFSYKGENYQIPSDMFPLTGEEVLILNAFNTYPLKNKKIEDIFNHSTPEIGKCYANSTQLYNLLIENGISQHHLKYCVGWIFVEPGLPIQHAFLLYKDKYVLDQSISLKGKYLKNFCNSVKKEDTQIDIKRKYAKQIIEMQKLPLSKSATFGKMIEYFLFIGCESSEEAATEVYLRVNENYPHLFFPKDESGNTELQRMVINK